MGGAHIKAYFYIYSLSENREVYRTIESNIERRFTGFIPV